MKRIIISFCMLTLLLFSCKTKQTIKTSNDLSNEVSEQAKGEQQWPKTVKEAVANILSEMSIKDKEIIRNTKKEDLIKYHHGWGTGIRNSFGLWSGNKALMKDTKANHPDDASMVIIEAVWEELQK